MIKLLAEWNFEPDLMQARQLRAALQPVLSEYQVPEPDRFLLAVAELVVNLSRYPEPRPRHASLRLLRDQYGWALELEDDGGSFRDFSRYIHATGDLTAAEGGMGLRLLAQAFDDVSYVPACYRDNARNLMVLRAQDSSDTPGTVLVVDDDPVFRALMSAYLSDQYRVVEAADVRTAFELLLHHKPALVICDVTMPEQDGTVLFDQLGQMPMLATTAFIYITGADDEALIAHARARPVDDLLHKPVSKAQLLQTVRRVLTRCTHLAQQLSREVEQKVTLGLQPALPAQIGAFNCELRCRVPEAGGGDLVLLRDRKLVFADLMGHGVQAKGFVFALAGYLRGLCAALAHQPLSASALLSLLSTGFNDDPVLSETLATLLVAELDDAGRVTLANAGHPAPLRIADGAVARVDVAGPLLGLGCDEYPPVSVQLKPGERLLLCSDGFFDAGAPVPQALLQEIERCAGWPLRNAADHLMAWRFQGQDSSDDCTLILLEYGGQRS